MGTLLFWPNELPKAPAPNHPTGGVKISAYEIWRDTNMQSLVEP